MPDLLSEEKIGTGMDKAKSCAALTFCPTADVNLSPSFVGKDDTPRAKYIRLDVHFAPCVSKIVDKGGIELVCTGGIVELSDLHVKKGQS
jgi:hypothetical protein